MSLRENNVSAAISLISGLKYKIAASVKNNTWYSLLSRNDGSLFSLRGIQKKPASLRENNVSAAISLISGLKYKIAASVKNNTCYSLLPRNDVYRVVI